MQYILFDDSSRTNLLPLTYTRPVADIRTGILTIREKWEHFLGVKTATLTEDYLSEKYPFVPDEHIMLINGSISPNERLYMEIMKLNPNEALTDHDVIIAQHVLGSDLDAGIDREQDHLKQIETDIEYLKISYPWEIFSKNAEAISADYKLLTKNRKSVAPPKNCQIAGIENIFIEEGAKINFATLNAESGPIYIGKDAEIMEGTMIRGPFALCDHSTVKMGAKIYGPTTIGPYSKVGGELNSVVIFGYSNKAHDGFLGHSVIGEWCNLGADTNTSNLKNTYETVKMWNYAQKTFINTGLQFCGLIMGDHSKCGINTMFNTGTVVGVFCNIFGSGFQRVFISSFSWGGTAGISIYDINKAVEVARRVTGRRDISFSETDENILRSVFEVSFENRKFKY